jgi:hypothetical protein
MFIGGASLIFTTFVFVAPAMPRLNPAGLDLKPLPSLTTEDHRTSVDVNSAKRGTRVELGPLDRAPLPRAEAVKVGHPTFQLASASNFTDAAEHDARFDSPFGVRAGAYTRPLLSSS